MSKWVYCSIAVLVGISGCSADKHDSIGLDGSKFDPSSEVSGDGMLARATSESFLRYLRTALAGGADMGVAEESADNFVAVGQAGGTGSDAIPTAPEAAADYAASTSGGSSDRLASSTNVQEVGVDEADLIKFDAARGIIYAIDYGVEDKPVYPEVSEVGLAEVPPEGAGEVPESGDSGDTGADDAVAEPAPAADIDYYPGPTQQLESVRIMALSGDSATVTEIANITRDEGDASLRGLYLAPGEERLVAVGSGASNVWGDWFMPAAFMQQTTQIDVLDVSQPEKPSAEVKYEFDGSLIASRMVGSHLYLVLRQYPQIDHWYAYPATAEEKAQNETTVTELTEQDLLPQYRVDEGDQQDLVDAGDCYLNRGVAEPTADLVTLVSVDVSKATPTIESTCFVGPTEALYASQNALYLSSTRYNYSWSDSHLAYPAEMTTDIHKFAFDGPSFTYRGSAEVIGHLGWLQGRKSFRFSESAEGDLRVVTYADEPFIGLPVDVGVGIAEVDGSEAEPAPSSGFANPGQARALNVEVDSPVYLTILSEAAGGQSLETLSRLPNAARPAPIGKPGEDLYASRYVGDRAYLITFRMTDPVYVLDLSNPRDPSVLSELEISGFSDYLHPVSEDLLLGVGKDAVPDTTDWGDGRGAWYQGVKLSLLDVSDPASPQEVDKVIIGQRGTESAVLSDHHAFTGLKVNDQYRVSLPVTLHSRYNPYGSGAPWDYSAYTRTGLYRYNIDLESKTIKPISPMVVHEASSDIPYYSWEPYQNGDDRSLIVDDYVHYLHSGQFWSAAWETDAVITGPQ